MSHTYSFLDTLASIAGPGGAIPLGASAANSDEGITVDPVDEINKMTIGADSQGMHSLIANYSAKITVRLLKTSPINALLNAMVQFQRMSSITHGQNVITIINMGLGDNITCSQVAFTKIPQINYKKEGDIVEWQFDAIRCDMILGTGVLP